VAFPKGCQTGRSEVREVKKKRYRNLGSLASTMESLISNTQTITEMTAAAVEGVILQGEVGMLAYLFG